MSNIFIRVVVAISPDLITISSVIGWLYFIAWSVSFYPQIYINYTRKSVVGLNFDFLSLNIVGFLLYGIFNIGLYTIPEIQVHTCFSQTFSLFLCSKMSFSFYKYHNETFLNIWAKHVFFLFENRRDCIHFLLKIFQDEYTRRFPRGVNPVQLNDVFFAFHATFATLITIAQCFTYEVSIN